MFRVLYNFSHDIGILKRGREEEWSSEGLFQSQSILLTFLSTALSTKL